MESAAVTDARRIREMSERSAQARSAAPPFAANRGYHAGAPTSPAASSSRQPYTDVLARLSNRYSTKPSPSPARAASTAAERLYPVDSAASSVQAARISRLTEPSRSAAPERGRRDAGPQRPDARLGYEYSQAEESENGDFDGAAREGDVEVNAILHSALGDDVESFPLPLPSAASNGNGGAPRSSTGFYAAQQATLPPQRQVSPPARRAASPQRKASTAASRGLTREGDELLKIKAQMYAMADEVRRMRKESKRKHHRDDSGSGSMDSGEERVLKKMRAASNRHASREQQTASLAAEVRIGELQEALVEYRVLEAEMKFDVAKLLQDVEFWQGKAEKLKEKKSALKCQLEDANHTIIQLKSQVAEAAIARERVTSEMVTPTKQRSASVDLQQRPALEALEEPARTESINAARIAELSRALQSSIAECQQHQHASMLARQEAERLKEELTRASISKEAAEMARQNSLADHDRILRAHAQSAAETEIIRQQLANAKAEAVSKQSALEERLAHSHEAAKLIEDKYNDSMRELQRQKASLQDAFTQLNSLKQSSNDAVHESKSWQRTLQSFFISIESLVQSPTEAGADFASQPSPGRSLSKAASLRAMTMQNKEQLSPFGSTSGDAFEHSDDLTDDGRAPPRSGRSVTDATRLEAILSATKMLRTKLLEVQGHNTALLQQRDAAVQAATKAEERLRALIFEKSDSDSAIKAAETARNAAVAGRTEAEQSLNAVTQERNRLQSQMDVFREQVEEMINRKNAELTALQDKHAALIADFSAKEKECEQLRSVAVRVPALEDKLRATEDANNRVQNLLAQERAALSEASRSNEQLLSEVNKLQTQLSTSSHDSSSQHERVDQLLRQIENLKQVEYEMKRKIAVLEGTVEELEEARATIKENLAQTVHREQTTQQAMLDLQAQTTARESALQRQLQDRVTQLSALEAQANTREAALQKQLLDRAAQASAVQSSLQQQLAAEKASRDDDRRVLEDRIRSISIQKIAPTISAPPSVDDRPKMQPVVTGNTPQSQSSSVWATDQKPLAAHALQHSLKSGGTAQSEAEWDDWDESHHPAAAAVQTPQRVEPVVVVPVGKLPTQVAPQAVAQAPREEAALPVRKLAVPSSSSLPVASKRQVESPKALSPAHAFTGVTQTPSAQDGNMSARSNELEEALDQYNATTTAPRATNNAAATTKPAVTATAKPAVQVTSAPPLVAVESVSPARSSSSKSPPPSSLSNRTSLLSRLPVTGSNYDVATTVSSSSSIGTPVSTTAAVATARALQPFSVAEPVQAAAKPIQRSTKLRQNSAMASGSESGNPLKIESFEDGDDADVLTPASQTPSYAPAPAPAPQVKAFIRPPEPVVVQAVAVTPAGADPKAGVVSKPIAMSTPASTAPMEPELEDIDEVSLEPTAPSKTAKWGQARAVPSLPLTAAAPQPSSTAGPNPMTTPVKQVPDTRSDKPSLVVPASPDGPPAVKNAFSSPDSSGENPASKMVVAPFSPLRSTDPDTTLKLTPTEAQAIRESAALVQNLSDEDISTLRNSSHISDVVAVLAGAVCMLLGEKPSWKQAVALMKLPEFRSRVVAVDPVDVPPRNIQIIQSLIVSKKLREYISGPSAKCDPVRNRAEFALVTWVLNICAASLAAQERKRTGAAPPEPVSAVAGAGERPAATPFSTPDAQSRAQSAPPGRGRDTRATDSTPAAATPLPPAHPSTPSSSSTVEGFIIGKYVASDEKLKAFVDSLAHGVRILKIPAGGGFFGSSGQQRVLFLEKRAGLDALAWNKTGPNAGSERKGRSVTPSSSESDESNIYLGEIVEIVAGMATPVLHKKGKKDKAHLYVSLITPGRSLDLECDSPAQRDWIMQGWQGLLAIIAKNRRAFLPNDV